MNREELLDAGWEQVTTVLEYPAYGGYLWRHPDVLGGVLHEFDEAVEAERTRKKMDGGA